MPLQPGTTLGPYAVTALIGEGGMGQVYQATDTKLNRQVALKILPEAFAADPDRLARFEREAHRRPTSLEVHLEAERQSSARLDVDDPKKFVFLPPRLRSFDSLM